jgi:phosphatidylglycerophosphate synthase
MFGNICVEKKHYNTVTQYGVTLDRVLDGILDLLTTLTHNS